MSENEKNLEFIDKSRQIIELAKSYYFGQLEADDKLDDISYLIFETAGNKIFDAFNLALEELEENESSYVGDESIPGYISEEGFQQIRDFSRKLNTLRADR